MPERFSPTVLRAAWWTVRALRAARRALRSGTVHGVRLPPPPAVSPRGIRGVAAVLRRTDHTCLERSIVLQRWHSAHGSRRDVVVGVTAPRNGFTAHAWLDGDAEDVSEFRELLRLPAG